MMAYANAKIPALSFHGKVTSTYFYVTAQYIHLTISAKWIKQTTQINTGNIKQIRQIQSHVYCFIKPSIYFQSLNSNRQSVGIMISGSWSRTIGAAHVLFYDLVVDNVSKTIRSPSLIFQVKRLAENKVSINR